EEVLAEVGAEKPCSAGHDSCAHLDVLSLLTRRRNAIWKREFAVLLCLPTAPRIGERLLAPLWGSGVSYPRQGGGKSCRLPVSRRRRLSAVSAVMGRTPDRPRSRSPFSVSGSPSSPST